MLAIVSSYAIVTSSLRRAGFQIFDFKNIVTLKPDYGSVMVIENITVR